MITDRIVDIAKSYIGFTEKPNNSGFTNASFEKRMKEVGWSKSLSWCCFFCELVWTEAYENKDIVSQLDKLFSGSATTTFKNFDLSKDWKVSDLPKPGALVVWRHGNGWQGHIGIVESVEGEVFMTIEGNTNDKGGREGYIVARKRRLRRFTFQPDGLNLIGFIYPKEL